MHVSFLTDDYYHYDEKSHALIGERTANVYRVGDEVKIRVAGVNMDEHAIDFELVGSGTKARKRKPIKNDKSSEKGRPPKKKQKKNKKKRK
ncbi:hypothetical protein P9268_15725 [Oceanobacillus caeni]|nr:hypothetical protein [Oceanobacillus caeni]